MISGKGSLFVVSAPSGSGKTTVCQRVLEELPDLAFSISHTTRPERYGERSGVDYFFIKRDEFLSMIDRGEFLEWAVVHGHYYGTAKKQVEDCLSTGKDVLLDIDVQGARQVRDKIRGAILIFIVPPSFEVLEERLRRRQSDNEEAIKLRLSNAHNELKAIREYDYIIVNDDLDDAVKKFSAVVQADRSRCSRVINNLTWLSLV